MEEQDASPRTHHPHDDNDDNADNNNNNVEDDAADYQQQQQQQQQQTEHRRLLLLVSWRQQYATREAGFALARLMAYVALGCACGGAGLPALLPLAVAYCVETALPPPDSQQQHALLIVAQGVCATQASLLCLANHKNNDAGWLAGYAVMALWCAASFSSSSISRHLRAPAVAVLALCALATQQPPQASSTGWWLQLLFLLVRAAVAAVHSLWLRVATNDGPAGPSPLLLAPSAGALGLAVLGVAVHAVVFLMVAVLGSSSNTITTTTTTTTTEKPQHEHHHSRGGGVVRLPLAAAAAATLVPLPHEALFNTDTLDVQEAFRLAKAQYRSTVESSKSN